jgi:hypothetical protein
MYPDDVGTVELSGAESLPVLLLKMFSAVA